MTVDGVHEPNNEIANEEHDHTALAKKVKLVDSAGSAITATNALPVDLVGGDIQIGAVEIKDATTDTRVKVKTDGTDNAVVMTQNSQPLPAGAATELTLSGVLTNTQLRATPIAISGTVSSTISGEITATVSNMIPAVETGLATSANQTNGDQLVKLVDSTGGAITSTNPFSSEITSIDYAAGKSGIDSATETLQTITYEHHEIHSGSHYFVVGVQTLSINNVIDFTWQTPNTSKWIHWLWKLDTEGQYQWYIYENAVVVNPLANDIVPFNSDRNSLNVSGSIMKYEVHANLTAANVDTNVTGATLLKSGIAGAGKNVGGLDSRDAELILKQNTIYCLRGVAVGAGFIDFDMEWYEHTNKN